MKQQVKSIFLIFLFSLAFSGCKPKAQESEAAEKTPVVFTSILPQKYLVERIAEKHVQVQVMIPMGKSPHSYEPTPQQIEALAKAKIFFRIDVPFEEALLKNIKANLPNLKIIDTSEGITKRHLEAHHHEHEEHAEEEHHEHKEDPHIWLSPSLAKIQAEHIYNALLELDSENKEIYTQNYTALLKDLDSIDKELKEVFSSHKGKSIYVFHPAFGYLTDAWGLKQVAIEIEGKEPTAKALTELIEKAKQDKVKIIFVQKQFSKTAAQKVAEAIGGVVVNIDPLSDDYINNLRHIAEEVQKAF